MDENQPGSKLSFFASIKKLMSYSDPNIPQPSRTRRSPPTTEENFKLPSSVGFSWLIDRLSIRQKISYGYALAVGVAVLGAGTGLAAGEYFRNQALKQVTQSREEQLLLGKLKIAVLETRDDQQELILSLQKTKHFNYKNFNYKNFNHEKLQLLEHLDQVKSFFSKVKSSQSEVFKDSAQETQEFKKWLRINDDIPEAYSQKFKALLKQLNWNVQPKAIAANQAAVLDFSAGQVATHMGGISDSLTTLLEISQREEYEAVRSAIQADKLRIQIISTSMLVALVLATILALYTSRSISRPLEAATQFAQRVTEDANFDIQAPVFAQDEVGQLTKALNQLIQRVAQHTEELKQTPQLIQTEKMSSLGRMVAGIAHEINNPINFIHGNIQHTTVYLQDLLNLAALYQQQYPHPTPVIQAQLEAIDLEFMAEDLPRMLSSMKIGAERVRQIVLSLRNFSRLDEAEVKAVNLHEGIDSTLLILNHRLKNGVIVLKEYGDLPLVECYPSQINQVFMNILSNAIDALLSSAEQPDKQITIQTQTIASNKVQVRIWDSGPGMPPQVVSKIFDPFFTTKPIGQGTGLGLSIGYQIIKKHQGQITVNSQLGQGAEFVLTLPIEQGLAT